MEWKVFTARLNNRKTERNCFPSLDLVTFENGFDVSPSFVRRSSGITEQRKVCFILTNATITAKDLEDYLLFYVK